MIPTHEQSQFKQAQEELGEREYYLYVGELMLRDGSICGKSKK